MRPDGSKWARLGTMVATLAVGALLQTAPAMGALGDDPAGRGGETAGTAAADYFTNLPLITDQGREIHFFNDLLAGRIVLITGFYINCTTICPQQNLQLSRLQTLLGERLGREVGMISISVDPRRDTPEKVAAYAKVFRPKPGWIFVTGKPENVDWVNYKLGQYYEDLELHKGFYLLGNLKTGDWVKLSPQAKAEEVLQKIEKVMKRESGRP